MSLDIFLLSGLFVDGSPCRDGQTLITSGLTLLATSMETKKSKSVCFADGIGGSNDDSVRLSDDLSRPISPTGPAAHSRRLVAQNSAGELELLDFMSKSGTNVANFHLAIYIGMANAGLIFAMLLLYGVGLLLKDYWQPIQWAILISMPLREVQGVVVHFWETPLQMGFVETLVAVPFAMLNALMETAHDAHGAYLVLSGSGLHPPKIVTFTQLCKWLLSFGMCTLGLEYFGFVPILALIILGIAGHLSVVNLLPIATEAFPMRAPRAGERRSSAARLFEWTVQPIVRATRWSNRGVTQSLIRRLPALAAIFIIITMVVTVLGGAVLFSYKVGVEGKDAVITLKTHVQSSQYGSSMRLSQWLEDNQIPQYIDQHMTNAYENLLQKVDTIAAKNNMTDLANMGKEFLNGIAHRGTPIDIPDEPQKVKSAKTGYSLVDLFQHLKVNVLGNGLSTIAKKALVSGGNFMTGGLYILIVLGTSVVSFVTQAFVFVSVLYLLLTSESGGVMYQALDMVPLSHITRQRCATVLDRAVSSVLLATTKTMFFQTLFTYLLFRFFRVHFLYMSTLIALVQGLIPLFPKWVASLPAILQLALQRRYLEGLVLMALHKCMMDYGVLKIQGPVIEHSQYLTGLSIAGGMTLFTPAISVGKSRLSLQARDTVRACKGGGGIMGPLLMTVLIAARNLYAEFVLKVHTEYQQES